MSFSSRFELLRFHTVWVKPGNTRAEKMFPLLTRTLRLQAANSWQEQKLRTSSVRTFRGRRGSCALVNLGGYPILLRGSHFPRNLQCPTKEGVFGLFG
jgi:hypothetical protein